MGESIKIKEDRSPSSYIPRKPFVKNTAATLYADTGKSKTSIFCVYCNGSHFFASCEHMKDINLRRDILKQKGRCFVCLRQGHRMRECTSNKNCRHCGNKHHQSICYQESKKTNGNTPEPVEKEESATIASAASQGKSQVLLQTAKTIAYKDGETRGIPVRILFDSGSQRSYVSESLKTKLKLQPSKKETLKLNTFGGEKITKNICGVVNFYVKGKRGESLEIQALTFPKICTALPSKVDLSDYPHLENLELADPLDSNS
eukprot:Seg2451.3 transcript_id=Seg2451.3/GoldUCD/mRNA.D3Y31 product="hypothetical protein" protein_id=Seg2451.3/GoldUCD/D3Y31